MRDSDPHTWTAPSWHPDYGDPQEELQLLKDFCLRLLQKHPAYSVQLAVPEEGYMNIDVFRGTTKVGELYIVDNVAGKRDRRYGLFLSENCEEEHYFEEIEQGLAYLADDV